MPSSVIKAFDYDPFEQRLRVRYVSGSVYDYLDVPLSVYEAMKQAKSKGEFLNKEVKGRFQYVRKDAHT